MRSAPKSAAPPGGAGQAYQIHQRAGESWRQCSTENERMPIRHKRAQRGNPCKLRHCERSVAIHAATVIASAAWQSMHFRHCERSAAIHGCRTSWIAASLALLAMTEGALALLAMTEGALALLAMLSPRPLTRNAFTPAGACQRRSSSAASAVAVMSLKAARVVMASGSWITSISVPCGLASAVSSAASNCSVRVMRTPA